MTALTVFQWRALVALLIANTYGNDSRKQSATASNTIDFISERAHTPGPFSDRGIAVILSPKYAPVASPILRGFDHPSESSEILPRIFPLSQPVCLSNARKLLDTENAVWATADEATANWLAGTRTVFYLDDKRLAETPLQRLSNLTFLLSISMRSEPNGKAEADSLSNSSRKLREQIEIEADSNCPPTHEINPLAAVGYWISHGLQLKQLKTTSVKPKRRLNTVWLNRESDEFYIHPESINSILRRQKASPWDLGGVRTAIEHSSLHRCAKFPDNSAMWLFSTSILTTDARNSLIIQSRCDSQQLAVTRLLMPHGAHADG